MMALLDITLVGGFGGKHLARKNWVNKQGLGQPTEAFTISAADSLPCHRAVAQRTACGCRGDLHAAFVR
jgi:hypothetical protein